MELKEIVGEYLSSTEIPDAFINKDARVGCEEEFEGLYIDMVGEPIERLNERLRSDIGRLASYWLDPMINWERSTLKLDDKPEIVDWALASITANAQGVYADLRTSDKTTTEAFKEAMKPMERIIQGVMAGNLSSDIQMTLGDAMYRYTASTLKTPHS